MHVLSSSLNRTHMKRTRDEPIDDILRALLDAFAPVLLKLGVTPAKLAHIARASFVAAGASHAQKGASGRLHLAKIAALTGLTRSEVKRIVAAGFATGDARTDSSPRALRVLKAWRQSDVYADRGKPKRLRINGRAPSFVALCHDHSGDIPYRVILDQLRRDGLVSVNNARTHVSPLSRKNGQANEPELDSLRFAAIFLKLALQSDAVILRRRQRVQTSSTVPSAYIEKAVASRVSELMEQVPNLFPRKKIRGRDAIDVFALVARAGKSKE